MVKKEKIMRQFELVPRGGSDASAVQRAGIRAKAITLSIPT